MKRYDAYKRDNMLVDLLRKHRGAGNIISGAEITEYLNAHGYPSDKASINMLIRRVMYERHLPICSLNAKGYFWASNKAEIQVTINDLQGRIEEMQNRISILKSFIID